MLSLGQSRGFESAGMTEYQIDSNTRRCAVSGRELKIGERFFSVLFEESGKWQRKDYSSEAWQGPPQGTFSFWSGRIPAAEQQTLPAIDDEARVAPSPGAIRLQVCVVSIAEIVQPFSELPFGHKEDSVVWP